MDKKQLIPFLDLTSLGEDDTPEKIIELCEKAHTPLGNVACVCVYPKFVSVCKRNTKIPVATVINFPHGTDTPEKVFNDTRKAIEDGADEIDLVIPYKSIIETNGSEDSLAQCKEIVLSCQKALTHQKLKVIVESGAFNNLDLLAKTCDVVLSCGVDFLKTSTGKITTGATLEAVEVFAKSLKSQNAKTGIKISGGVKTYEQALPYINLIREQLGDDFLKPDTFRIGASSLLSDLLQNP